MSTAEQIAPSTLYRCCDDWEHNGYDDSDWYCVAYDTSTGTLRRVEVGSTRHGGGVNHGGGVLPMTDDVRPFAHAALVDMYEQRLTASERRRVEEPRIETLTRGVAVRFLEAHRCMRKGKNVIEQACDKCNGSGKWTNPRRASDQRECFACKGAGTVKRTTRTRAKDADGKQAWEKIDVGTVATVHSTMTVGTFYKDGYNQPGRHNTTAYVTLEDGREVQAPAAKLRLGAEMPSAKAIRAMAEDMAARLGAYYALFPTSHVSMV